MRFTLIENARLIFPDRIEPRGSLLIEQGRIAKITYGGQKHSSFKLSRAIAKETWRVDAKGAFLAPGFIDLHIHGALGHDTMDATFDAWNAISRYHASGGTTSFALTTVTCSFNALERVLACANQHPALEGARLLGIHVEGPFLSPEKPGAHRIQLMQTPNLKKWLARFKNYLRCITQITLAPELNGALPFIRAMRRQGIICSAGHTNASDVEFHRARKVGLDHVTHLFNCMSMAHKRGFLREAGVVEAALADTDVHAELIADGMHVSPTLLRMAYHAKGPENLMLITDATAGAGLKAHARFELGALTARVCKGYALSDAPEPVLAGSTIRMIDSVATMVRRAGVPLYEAVRMATFNPAKRLGKEKEVGQLRSGAQADLLLFNDRFQVLQTWRAGQIIYTVPSFKRVNEF